jgi:hypothetical protein
MSEFNPSLVSGMGTSALNQFMAMKQQVATQRLAPQALSGNMDALNKLMGINPEAGMKIAQYHTQQQQFAQQRELQGAQLDLERQKLPLMQQQIEESKQNMQLKQQEADRMKLQMEAQQRQMQAGNIQFQEGRPWWVGYDEKSGKMTTAPLHGGTPIDLTEKEGDFAEKVTKNINDLKEKNVQPFEDQYTLVNNALKDQKDLGKLSAAKQGEVLMSYIKTLNPSRMNQISSEGVHDMKELQGRIEALEADGVNVGALRDMALGRLTEGQIKDLANSVIQRRNSAWQQHFKDSSPYVNMAKGRLGEKADKFLPDYSSYKDADLIGEPTGEKPGIQAPRVGEEKSGYRFKGGNPADPKSWEKM